MGLKYSGVGLKCKFSLFSVPLGLMTVMAIKNQNLFSICAEKNLKSKTICCK